MTVFSSKRAVSNQQIYRAFACAMLLVSLFCEALDAEANDKRGRKHYWFNLGIGIMTVSEDLYSGKTLLTKFASFSYQNRYHLFTIRHFDIVFPGAYNDFQRMRFRDIGLLYGISTNKKNWQASFSAGSVLARVLVPSSNDRYEFDVVNQVGLGLGIQLFLRPLKNLGLGFYGLANINQKKNLFSPLLNLQLYFNAIP